MTDDNAQQAEELEMTDNSAQEAEEFKRLWLQTVLGKVSYSKHSLCLERSVATAS